MGKATKSRGAEARWNYEAIRDVLPKTHRKMPDPRTNGIEVSYLDAMIQVDIGTAVDDSCIMLGRDKYKTKQEIVADQIVDAAKGRLAEWEENEENFKDHVRYDIPAMAKRAAAMMNKIQGSSDKTIHNTSALEQIEEFKARRLDRRIEWRIDFWNRRHKDLQDAVDDAIEKQQDMRDALDKRLAESEEEEIFLDERTKDEAFIEHYMQEMDYWSSDQLCVMLNTNEFYSDETRGLIRWKANLILNERLAADWKKAKSKKARLIEEIIHENRTGDGPVSKGERHWRMIDINQKAIKAHGTKEAWVLMLEHIIPKLGWHLVQEGVRLAGKRIKKLKEAEVEFWDRQNNPPKIIGVEATEKFWFDDGNGGYLLNSCTDIKFLYSGGVGECVEAKESYDTIETYKDKDEENWPTFRSLMINTIENID